MSEDTVGAALGGDAESVLAALAALRALRDELDAQEPELIAAARAAGVSWARLAPVLGVASRQAAERRYLRIRQSPRDDARLTGDQRVTAERDRRAGDRAVAAWADQHTADLRQLAARITLLEPTQPGARASLERLRAALGGNDHTVLLQRLAETLPYLPSPLAAEVTRVGDDTVEVRRTSDRARGVRRLPGTSTG
jgi:hypothetical protein